MLPRPPKPKLTHFLCVPLVTSSSKPQLEKALSTFRADVAGSGESGNQGTSIPNQAIRPLGTLHLTLGVMSLPSPERVAGALAILKSLDLRDMLSRSVQATEEASAGSREMRDSGETRRGEEEQALVVTLKGLKALQTPRKTTSLYVSPVDADQRLQKFCQGVKDAFRDFLVVETRPLRLHATVVNTIYVKGGRGKRGRQRDRVTVDARDVIEKYKDFEWMSNVKLQQLCICRMGVKKGGGDGAEVYEIEASVDLPGDYEQGMTV